MSGRIGRNLGWRDQFTAINFRRRELPRSEVEQFVEIQRICLSHCDGNLALTLVTVCQPSKQSANATRRTPSPSWTKETLTAHVVPGFNRQDRLAVLEEILLNAAGLRAFSHASHGFAGLGLFFLPDCLSRAARKPAALRSATISHLAHPTTPNRMRPEF